MALVQSSTFTGVANENVRAHARTRQLQDLLNVAKDQALLWESITGLKVPPTSGAHSISATPHIHDGTNGVIIPIPLIQQVINLEITSPAVSGDYAPFHWPLLRIPPGVSTVRVVIQSDLAFANLARVTTYNSSMARQSSFGFHPWAQSGMPWAFNDSFMFGEMYHYSDVTVDDDALIAFALEWPDSVDFGGHPNPEPVRCSWYCILPWAGLPRQIPPYIPPTTGADEVIVPLVDHHLDWSADAAPFTSFDDGMFSDNRGVSSYVVKSMSHNDALCFELATGKPAGDNAIAHTNEVQYSGHNHREDTAYTGDLGADIDQTLLAVSLGVARANPDSGVPGAYLAEDEDGAGNWRGAIFGPTLTSAAGTTARELGYWRFRIPSAQTSFVHSTGTPKINVAALAYVDTGKVGNLEVEFTVYSGSYASAGTATTLTFNSTGRTIQTSTLDMFGVGATGDGVDAVVRVRMRTTTNASPPGAMLYSFCIWYAA